MSKDWMIRVIIRQEGEGSTGTDWGPHQHLLFTSGNRFCKESLRFIAQISRRWGCGGAGLQTQSQPNTNKQESLRAIILPSQAFNDKPDDDEKNLIPSDLGSPSFKIKAAGIKGQIRSDALQAETVVLFSSIQTMESGADLKRITCAFISSLSHLEKKKKTYQNSSGHEGGFLRYSCIAGSLRI